MAQADSYRNWHMGPDMMYGWGGYGMVWWDLLFDLLDPSNRRHGVSHQVADPHEQGTFRGAVERFKDPGIPKRAVCEG